MPITKEIRQWYLENEISKEEIVVTECCGNYSLRCKSPSLETCGTLELIKRHKEMVVNSLLVYVTRVGIGTKLMTKALEICDELELPCSLEVVPDETEISYNSLIKFYKSFGFKEIACTGHVLTLSRPSKTRLVGNVDSETIVERMIDLNKNYHNTCVDNARKEMHAVIDAYFDSESVDDEEKQRMLTIVFNLLSVSN